MEGGGSLGYKVQKEGAMVVVQTYPLQLTQNQAQPCAEVRREAGTCWNR